MQIKKTQILEFKQETLNMNINDFDVAYLKDLINTKYKLSYSVNGVDKLTTHIWHKNNCKSTTFEQFLNYIDNNQEIVEIIALQSLEYSLYNGILNKIGKGMKEISDKLKENETANIGNFQVKKLDWGINEKTYTYNNEQISNWVYAKHPEEIRLDELKKDIERLENIEKEATELYEKYVLKTKVI